MGGRAQLAGDADKTGQHAMLCGCVRVMVMCG